MLVIVPDSLANAINAKLDEAIAAVPDAAKDRDHLYHQLLSYFNEHGSIPDFTLVKARPLSKCCDRCDARQVPAVLGGLNCWDENCECHKSALTPHMREGER